MTGSHRVAIILRRANGPLHRAWKRFLALTRLSLAAVCTESALLGRFDYHTYADDVDGVPWTAQGGGQCRRCGKRFRL